MAFYPANSEGGGLQLKNYQATQTQTIAANGYGTYIFDISSLGLTNNDQVVLVQDYNTAPHILVGGIAEVSYLRVVINYHNTTASDQPISCTISVLYTD